MIIHPKVHDLSTAGMWDIHTTRYVPVSGGSRSRLPVLDDPHIRRYYGFVGMSEHLTQDVFLIAALYQVLGGKPEVAPGQSGKFTELLIDQTMERLEILAARQDEAQDRHAPSAAG